MRRARTCARLDAQPLLVPASRLVRLPAGFDPPLGVIVDVDDLPPLSDQVDVVEARLERAGRWRAYSARVFLEVLARRRWARRGSRSSTPARR